MKRFSFHVSSDRLEVLFNVLFHARLEIGVDYLLDGVLLLLGFAFALFVLLEHAVHRLLFDILKALVARHLGFFEFALHHSFFFFYFKSKTHIFNKNKFDSTN